MIFIDAQHEYEAVLADAIEWTAHLAPRGLLLLHDYCGWPGPTRAAHEMVHSGKVVFAGRVMSIVVLARDSEISHAW